MSAKAKAEKFLDLSVKNKKEARLMHYNSLEDRDIMFLNSAIEEKQLLHFKYGILFTMLSTVTVSYGLLRQSSLLAKAAFVVGVGYLQSQYWGKRVAERYDEIVDSYYEKYDIK